MKDPRVTFLIVLALLGAASACEPSTQSFQEGQSSFNLEKLLIDVFSPQPGEIILVMTDLPDGRISDNKGWEGRRGMAQEWHTAFQELEEKLEITVYPMLTYPATGGHNVPLPDEGVMEGQPVRFEEIFSKANIVVAMTEYSATAPLSEFTKRFPNLRAASMPMVSRSMEATALAEDYGPMADRCHKLGEKLDQASGAAVEFSTGHQMYFDLRFRDAEVDDGQLHAEKQGMRVINLPSGEAFIAPYEGEVEGQPSQTEGMIPALDGEELFLSRVEGNRIVEVIGKGPEAEQARAFIAKDEALRNVAELGLGCNEMAIVTGNVLEDEKVLGMHWALGRSDHIGGTVGPDDFSDPDLVVHEDFVYPFGGPIEISSLILEYEDGTREKIILDGQHLFFLDLSGEGDPFPNLDKMIFIWLLLAAGSMSFLAWDLEDGTSPTKNVKFAWVLATLVLGPFGLIAYLFLSRQQKSL